MSNCPTGKRRFKDEIAVKLAFATIHARDDASKGWEEIRSYQCNMCGGLHLTSATKKSYKRKRAKARAKERAKAARTKVT